MRLFSAVCLLFLLSGLAAAQTNIYGGYAGNWGPVYGPFVPLVNTPSVSLSPVSSSPVGASNATFGNVAGATNSTLSHEFVGQSQHSNPGWYGPSSPWESPMRPEHQARHEEKERSFDFVSESRESGESAARLLAESGPARKAARTYTNQDVERVAQVNNTVKFNGKTQQLQ